MGDVFKALADPTRRTILDELTDRNGQTLFEICSRLAVKHGLGSSRQAISQHLDVLEAAGLVETRREGRYKFHYINTTPLEPIVERWLKKTGKDAGGRLGTGALHITPLLASVPYPVINAVRDRGTFLDVTAGQEIIRRWEADRFFYIALSGRYDVVIDDRPIRTLGPGDHFGELAARDWGGGFGYTRLATVRCTEEGRLLRLSSEDFQWLVATQPTVRAELATILAERLQER